jgi:hypothetical protein
MVNIELGDLPKKSKKSSYVPIAIVKGDDKKCPDFNKFLLLDSSEKNPTINKQVDLPISCNFSLLPNADKDKRDCWYIAGQSGSGKSYIAKMLAENYCKMYPDRKIYLISKLDNDDTIDSANCDIIRLDYSDWDTEPPEINQIKNCMVIFDDVDTISKCENGIEVQQFADDIATMGRKHGDEQGNITMIYISHTLTNYKKSRILLLESTHYVLFPQNTSTNTMRHLLITHVGMDEGDIRQLKRLKSRWICIKKGFPSYLIYQHGSKLLFQDDDSEDEQEEEKVRKKLYRAVKGRK